MPTDAYARRFFFFSVFQANTGTSSNGCSCAGARTGRTDSGGARTRPAAARTSAGSPWPPWRRTTWASDCRPRTSSKRETTSQHTALHASSRFRFPVVRRRERVARDPWRGSPFARHDRRIDNKRSGRPVRSAYTVIGYNTTAQNRNELFSVAFFFFLWENSGGNVPKYESLRMILPFRKRRVEKIQKVTNADRRRSTLSKYLDCSKTYASRAEKRMGKSLTPLPLSQPLSLFTWPGTGGFFLYSRRMKKFTRRKRFCDV